MLLRWSVLRIARAQQALCAYLDTLTKALLTCVPEPPADVALHGFIKKTRTTPDQDLALARKRKKELEE